MRRRSRASAVVAALAVLVLVGIAWAPSFLSAVSAAATPTSGSASSGALPFADLPNAPASVRDARAPAPLSAEASAAVSAASAALRVGEDPSVESLVEAVEASQPNATGLVENLTQAQVDAALTPAGCVSCAETVGGLALAVAVAACAAGGVESLGTVCLAALAGAAIAAAVAYFLGSGVGGCSSCASAAESAGIAIVVNARQKTLLVDSLWASELSAINATTNALAYEASAAALDQIGNHTFDGALDLVQSGVAAQLDSVLLGLENELAAVASQTLNAFDITLGSPSGFDGYGCPDVGSPIAGALTASNACGAATTGSTSYPYGLVMGEFVVGETSESICGTACDVYIAGATTSQIVLDASGFASFHNLVTNTWTNFSSSTGKTLWNQTNWTQGSTVLGGPSGGVYAVNFTGLTSGFQSPAVFPLNGPTAEAMGISDVMSWGLSLLGSTAGSFPYTSDGLTGVSAACVGSGCVFHADDGGVAEFVNSSVPSVILAPYYLFTLASVAESTGAAYWAFLHLLGYYSVSAIPKNCVIPTPNVVLPTNVPPSELATANVTALLNLYLTYLNALGVDFNGSSLSSGTFCNHALPEPVANESIQFSVWGYGYIYLPSETRNSNGTAPQVFADPETWNASGEIFLAPSLGATSPAVNTTWELGDNPTYAYVEPLTTNTSAPTVHSGFANVTADGPTVCVTTGKDCQPNALLAEVLFPLVGNSSKIGGQVYTTAIANLTAGVAVDFVKCYAATSASILVDPTFVGAPCVFNVSSLVGPQGLCQYAGLVSQNGVECGIAPAPSPTPSPSSSCGDGIPVFGTIADYLEGLWGNWLGFGCLAAWFVSVVFVFALVGVLAYGLVVAVRAARGGGRDRD